MVDGVSRRSESEPYSERGSILPPGKGRVTTDEGSIDIVAFHRAEGAKAERERIIEWPRRAAREEVAYQDNPYEACPRETEGFVDRVEKLEHREYRDRKDSDDDA